MSFLSIKKPFQESLPRPTEQLGFEVLRLSVRDTMWWRGRIWEDHPDSTRQLFSYRSTVLGRRDRAREMAGGGGGGGLL